MWYSLEESGRRHSLIRLLISKSGSMKTKVLIYCNRQFFHFLFSPFPLLLPLFLLSWPSPYLPFPHYLKTEQKKKRFWNWLVLFHHLYLLSRWIGSRTGPNFKYYSNYKVEKQIFPFSQLVSPHWSDDLMIVVNLLSILP